MKILGLELKREYVVYYMEPQGKIWFYDEPKPNKEDLKNRIERLKHGNSKTKIKTKYTLMI